jgi:hypothetical protein
VMLAVGQAQAPETIYKGGSGSGGDVGGSGGGGGGGGGGSSSSSDALEAALAVLSERGCTLREARRVCDALLVGWLTHSDDDALTAWMPLSLHGTPAAQVRALGGDVSRPPKRPKPMPTAPANAPIVRNKKLVQSLGFRPRPMGQAPTNDAGDRAVWSYVRGAWVDAGGPGSTWKGQLADPDEPFKLELEHTDLDARIAAVNAGLAVAEVRDAPLDVVRERTKAATQAFLEAARAEREAEKAAEKAAAEEAAANAPSKVEVLRAALPKLESRLQLDVADPKWYEARLREKAEGGIAMTLHALERRTDPSADGVLNPAAQGCEACAGKHRPHTCGRPRPT